MAEEKKETPKATMVKIIVTERGGYRIQGGELQKRGVPFDISIENYNAMKDVVKHEVVKQ